MEFNLSSIASMMRPVASSPSYRAAVVCALRACVCTSPSGKSMQFRGHNLRALINNSQVLCICHLLFFGNCWIDVVDVGRNCYL